MARKIITVYGATGNQGGSVARSLLQNNSDDFSVRGITRNTESEKAKALTALGAEMVQADGTSKSQVVEAFKGSWGVFVNTNPDDPALQKSGGPSEVDLGKDIVDAALEAGVEHFVYSGLASAAKTTDGAFPNPAFDNKYAVGEYAKSKGFKTVTIASMGWYMENHLVKELAAVMGGFPYTPAEDGSYVLRMPSWGGKNIIPFISIAADFGDIVQGIFLSPDKYNGKLVQVVSQLATPEEMVAAFTHVTSKKARYEQMDSWKSFETYGDVGLENVKHVFGYLEASDGKYFGEPYDLTAAKELKAQTVKAKGLEAEELMTLEKVFATQLSS